MTATPLIKPGERELQDRQQESSHYRNELKTKQLGHRISEADFQLLDQLAEQDRALDFENRKSVTQTLIRLIRAETQRRENKP